MIRDFKGHINATRGLTILGHLESVVAEALTNFHAAKFSRDLGLHNILWNEMPFKYTWRAHDEIGAALDR